MSTSWYFASLEENGTGDIFAFLEDLPGVTAVGKSVAETLRYLTEFAADHVRDLADSGEAIPQPTPWERLPEKEPTARPVRAPAALQRAANCSFSRSAGAGLTGRID